MTTNTESSQKVTVLVTGSAGFIGRHLMEALGRRPQVVTMGYDVDSDPALLERGLAEADIIIHLAGANRPPDPAEFQRGNAGFTADLCARVAALGRRPCWVLASSIQADLENPYGLSKRAAEESIEHWAREQGVGAVIFRLPNVFGKWCRPNYNSVTATFCHNLARDLPISISDENRELDLVYIDDVIEAMMEVLDRPPGSGTAERREVRRSFRITLGDLAERLRSFRQSRRSLCLPSMEDPLTRSLYATYLSYLPASEFGYGLERKSDPRGSLAEFMKSRSFGQIFVSRTHPGITRGNHYHHTKTEKFLVLEGDAVIRFRRIDDAEVIEHRVSGTDFRVVDIPPGYTHSIENVGSGEMVVFFWASEPFDPERPDTMGMPVLS
jgi:UDP-2-acetamido-2,6-beta-L-arabino-hexul-4-ose reductase